MTATQPKKMDKSEQQSQLKLLIAKGKEQGYLTYAEVNDHLPNDIVDPEQIEDIVAMINDMGITVHETAPDADTITEAAADVDEDAAEEAAAALARLRDLMTLPANANDLECQAFLDGITTRTPPLTDGLSGLRTLRVLQAAQRSLMTGGEPIPMHAVG